ncbi:MAG: hypothetical protein NT121_13220, partial [Chloroflexi bacterium]|nr:hypothetical protein [Chloroflexota bacterium]
MTQINATVLKSYEYISPTRRTVMGIIFLALALGIWVFFSRTVTPDMETTFSLYPGGSPVVVPDWVFPTQPMLNALAFAG